MAGDKISVGAWAWNERKGSEDVYTQPPAMMGTLISTLAGGAGGFSGGEEGNGATIVGNLFSSENYLHAYEAIKTSTTDAANPRSYLNYLVFDREMNLVEEQSGAIQVDGTASQWRYLGLPDELVLHQSGYIAVYISDEDKVKVAWDDVQVIHTKGRLLEESHYYPHGGLYMHQSADAGMPKDQFTYQGMRLQDELSMNMHDFHARNFDAQIGRFPSIDPMDQFPSGYTGMGNNPANFVDPTGMYGSSTTVQIKENVFQETAPLGEATVTAKRITTGVYVGMADNVNGNSYGSKGGRNGGARTMVGRGGYGPGGGSGSGLRTIARHNGNNSTKQLSHSEELEKYGEVIQGLALSGGVGALIGGGYIEVGHVLTDKGYTQNYLTVYDMATTAGASVSLTPFVVNSNSGARTTFSDWVGRVDALSAGYEMFSYSRSWSTTYETTGVGIGFGITYPKVTGSYSSGTTYLIGQPYLPAPSTGDFRLPL